MSCITENTIVVKNQDIPVLGIAIKDNREKYGWVKNLQAVFHNDELSIFTFDCNGDAHSVDEQVDFLVFETNYLDGEPLITQVRDSETGAVKNARARAKYWIKKLIGEDAFRKIQGDLVYSDGRI